MRRELSKPVAQRSLLRMIVTRFEERPELLDQFEFIEGAVSSLDWTSPAHLEPETVEERRARTLAGLKDLVA